MLTNIHIFPRPVSFQQGLRDLHADSGGALPDVPSYHHVLMLRFHQQTLQEDSSPKGKCAATVTTLKPLDLCWGSKQVLYLAGTLFPTPDTFLSALYHIEPPVLIFLGPQTKIHAPALYRSGCSPRFKETTFLWRRNEASFACFPFKCSTHFNRVSRNSAKEDEN